jgi:hypothetical protein
MQQQVSGSGSLFPGRVKKCLIMAKNTHSRHHQAHHQGVATPHRGWFLFLPSGPWLSGEMGFIPPTLGHAFSNAQHGG